MKMAIRALVGVAGLLGILLALRIWMAPAEMGAQLGLAATEALGLATIRADIGGFFAAVGAFALAAAIKGRGGLLLPPGVLVALALAGRFVAIAMNGFSPEMGPPLIVEAVLLAVFAAGWRILPR